MLLIQCIRWQRPVLFLLAQGTTGQQHGLKPSCSASPGQLQPLSLVPDHQIKVNRTRDVAFSSSHRQPGTFALPFPFLQVEMVQDPLFPASPEGCFQGKPRPVEPGSADERAGQLFVQRSCNPSSSAARSKGPCYTARSTASSTLRKEHLWGLVLM